ncbi:hypothetical protein D3C78_1188460 [compost metagenome]
MQRQVEIGEHFAHPSQQTGLVECGQFQIAATVGMGRQETDFGRHAKMTQLGRRPAHARRLIFPLGNGLQQCVADRRVAVLGQRAAVRLQYDKGIHCHAVTISEDLRVMYAQVTAIHLPGHGGKQVRAVRAPDENFGAAARGLPADQHQRLGGIMGQQMARMPGQLVG